VWATPPPGNAHPSGRKKHQVTWCDVTFTDKSWIMDVTAHPHTQDVTPSTLPAPHYPTKDVFPTVCPIPPPPHTQDLTQDIPPTACAPHMTPSQGVTLLRYFIQFFYVLQFLKNKFEKSYWRTKKPGSYMPPLVLEGLMKKMLKLKNAVNNLPTNNCISSRNLWIIWHHIDYLLVEYIDFQTIQFGAVPYMYVI